MINLNELDRLVDDHLRFDAACSRAFCDDNNPYPTSNPHVYAALYRIRSYVLSGRVDEAVTLANSLCGKSVDDPNTQLNIRIHKLIELIYRAESIRLQHGDKESNSTSSLYNTEISKALEYSQQLASYALNAFPEAYSSFTNSMMLFVQPDQIMAPQFISERRMNLANQLVAIVRLSIGARDSDLSFLIRYLLVVYLQFRAPVISRDEETPPLHLLLQKLVNYQLGEEDSGGRIKWQTDTPSISKLGIPSSFPEEDIQDLPERVGISRQQSIDALKFTEGDVKAALRNELARVKICPKQFRSLVVDYCAARGLSPLKVNKNNNLKNNGSNECEHLVFKGKKSGKGEISNGMCVDFDTSLASLSPDGTRVMICENDLSPNAHAIWRVMCDVHEARTLPTDQAVLSGLRVAAKHGNLCNDATLHFRLAQREAMLSFERGALDEALSIVKDEMGPAEIACHGLMPSLRDTLSILACARPKYENNNAGGGEEDGRAESIDSKSTRNITSSQLLKSWPQDSDASRKFNDMVSGARARVLEHCSIDAITACFYSSLEQVHGEPSLVSLLRALLDSHVEWQLKCQQPDRFSAAFCVDALRTVYASTPYVSTDNMDDIESPRAQCDAQDQTNLTAGAQVVRQGIRDSTSEATADSRTERIVLTVMEFLELSRPEALSIMRNHPLPTNAEAIIESYFESV